MRVPIQDILITERHRKDYGNVLELVEDFRGDVGQITPITIRPISEEDKLRPGYAGHAYILVAGGRRMQAALLSGWSEIEAFSREDSIDAMLHLLMELNENVKRKEMDPLEVVAIKQKMFTDLRELKPELTQGEFARMIGETAANTSRDLKVAEIINERPELKQAGSKKAIIRMAQMEDHHRARALRESPSLTQQLEDKLVTGDAVQWMMTLPRDTVDLVLWDPPYMIDYHSAGHKSGEYDGLADYDDSEAANRDFFEAIMPELWRVLRPTGWLCCFMSEMHYGTLRGLAEKAGFIVAEPRWIWYRPNSINPPRYPERHAKNVYEHILVARKTEEARLMRPCDNLLVYDAEYGNRIHSNQKPIELLRDLVTRFTLSGELVIDPCFGSGSALAAAASLARDFAGCERNPGLRGPALGYVSQHYSGAAVRVPRSEFALAEEPIPF